MSDLLPSMWAAGRVRSLRARGGFTIGLRWEAGELQEVKVHPQLGLPFQVRYKDRVAASALAAGETLKLDHALSLHQ